MNIEEFIPINKESQDINQMSPLVWAYVGDCVYELYIRTYLVDNTSLKPHKLHIESIKYVKAGAQAKFLENFYEDLTDEEKDIISEIIVKKNGVVRKTVGDTDIGTKLKGEIEDLMELLNAYKNGEIKENWK